MKLFYVYYTNADGNIEVDRFHDRSNSRAQAASRQRVIVIPHPTFPNHNRGTLAFGTGREPYRASRGGGGGGGRLRRRPAGDRAHPPRPAGQAAADRPPRSWQAAVQRPEEQSLRRQA